MATNISGVTGAAPVLVAGQQFVLPQPSGPGSGGLNLAGPADNLALFQFFGSFGSVSGIFQASDDGVNWDSAMYAIDLSTNTLVSGVQTITFNKTFRMDVQGRRNVAFLCNSVSPNPAVVGGTIQLRIDSGFFSGAGPTPASSGLPSGEATGTTPNGNSGASIPLAGQALFGGNQFQTAPYDASREDGTTTGIIAASDNGAKRLQTRQLLVLQEMYKVLVAMQNGSGPVPLEETVLADVGTMGEDLGVH